jgi:hypothetical protein
MAGSLSPNAPKTTPTVPGCDGGATVPVLSEVEGSLVRRGGGTGETPAPPANAHRPGIGAPQTAAGFADYFAVPATVKVGFAFRKTSREREIK